MTEPLPSAERRVLVGSAAATAAAAARARAAHAHVTLPVMPISTHEDELDGLKVPPVPGPRTQTAPPEHERPLTRRRGGTAAAPAADNCHSALTVGRPSVKHDIHSHRGRTHGHGPDVCHLRGRVSRSPRGVSRAARPCALTSPSFMSGTTEPKPRWNSPRSSRNRVRGMCTDDGPGAGAANTAAPSESATTRHDIVDAILPFSTRVAALETLSRPISRNGTPSLGDGARHARPVLSGRRRRLG